MTVKNKTHQLTLMAMFAALAYILMVVGRLPISTVSFLKYDPKDVILVISGFVLGPMPALLVTVVVSLIEMLTVSSTGIIGLIMNVLSSAGFACTAAVIYKKRHSLKGAALGLVLGVVTMVVLMLLWNYFITPYYMGYPREAVAAMLVPVFLPFNLIKGALNAAIAMLIYKSISRALRRAGLMESTAGGQAPEKKSVVGAMLVAALVLVSCIFAVLIMKGIL
ncbi:MAG: ECF transporter S component [Eubacteriales bacterium]|nr:ECF transporter S component [Eubacteriales bacterium]